MSVLRIILILSFVLPNLVESKNDSLRLSSKFQNLVGLGMGATFSNYNSLYDFQLNYKLTYKKHLEFRSAFMIKPNTQFGTKFNMPLLIGISSNNSKQLSFHLLMGPILGASSMPNIYSENDGRLLLTYYPQVQFWFFNGMVPQSNLGIYIKNKKNNLIYGIDAFAFYENIFAVYPKNYNTDFWNISLSLSINYRFKSN